MPTRATSWFLLTPPLPRVSLRAPPLLPHIYPSPLPSTSPLVTEVMRRRLTTVPEWRGGRPSPKGCGQLTDECQVFGHVHGLRGEGSPATAAIFLPPAGGEPRGSFVLASLAERDEASGSRHDANLRGFHGAVFLGAAWRGRPSGPRSGLTGQDRMGDGRGRGGEGARAGIAPSLTGAPCGGLDAVWSQAGQGPAAWGHGQHRPAPRRGI